MSDPLAAREHADDVDVLIVGGGPVGAALALLIADTNARTAVVSPSPAPMPFRPIALAHPSYRLLDSVLPMATVPTTPITRIDVRQQSGIGHTELTAADCDVTALGHVADLSALSRALLAAAQALHIEGRVTSWSSSATSASATIQRPDGTTMPYRARLIVIADGGRHSDAESIDYRQSAVTGLVRTTMVHGGRAWECFTRDGPLALLPYEDRYAIVWSNETQTAERIATLPTNDFLARLAATFGSRLGRFHDIEELTVTPLFMRRGKPSTAPRCITIGNAAQVLHPVAGQGLNLGLRDAAALATLIRSYSLDALGDTDFIKSFDRKRWLDRSLTARVTDSLVRGFAIDSAAARIARGIALTILDATPPARAAFAQRMMSGVRGPF